MQIFDDLEEWKVYRLSLSPQLSLGFVPTMGNLHLGHCSLMTRAQQENDLSLVSLFINPTQFNQREDFVNYPKTLAADLALLERQKVDFCLIPQEKSIYKDGYRYQIEETEASQRMEGKHRPGHFSGVLTVVMKLLNLVEPTRAYFGEKDYQQYELIRDMVAAFFMKVEIIGCPTIREACGLAYSSRNNRLSNEGRLKAEKFARIFHQKKASEAIIAELEAQQILVEYLEDYTNRRYTAVKIDAIRLIDNLVLDF